MLCDDPEGRVGVCEGDQEEGNMYHIADSLLCTAEANTTL